MIIQPSDERVLKLYVSASDDIVIECDACTKINFKRSEAQILLDALSAILHPAGPAIDPVIIPDPVIDPVIDPVVDPVIDPVVDPVVDPVIDPVIDPVADPVI